MMDDAPALAPTFARSHLVRACPCGEPPTMDRPPVLSQGKRLGSQAATAPLHFAPTVRFR